jgi:hypothetical protein
VRRSTYPRIRFETCVPVHAVAVAVIRAKAFYVKVAKAHDRIRCLAQDKAFYLFLGRADRPGMVT